MNIAFVKRVVNGVTYARVELTRLGHLEFEKTLKGTAESIEDFLHMEDCQVIPNMDKTGWEKLIKFMLENPKAKQAFQATTSWIWIKGKISNQ